MEQLSPAALPATVLLLTSQWCTKAVVHSMSGVRWRLGSPVITVGGGYDGKHQFATRNRHSRNCHILTRVTLRCRFQRAIEAHLQSTPDHPSGSKIKSNSLGWEGHGHSNCLPCAIAARPSDLAVRDLSSRPR